MAQASRDQNQVTTLLGVSSSDGKTPTTVYADPTTHRLLVDTSGGSGITSINADATQAQLLVVGTAGTDFAIVDNGTGTHTFNLPTASASNRGALSSTDWSTFNSKQSALTIGNLTDVGTDGITIGSGTGAVIGSGTTISQHVADSSHNGYLSSTDWSTFNGKGSGTVTAVSIATANGFSGSSSGGATPALTIVAGAITPTSVNGLTISSTTGTFTLTNAKTLAVSDSTTLATNAITLGGGEVITFSASNALSLLSSGTTVMTFPAVTDTVAVLGTAQTYTATQTEKQVVWTNNAITASGNAATVPITSRLNTVTNNSAATLTITMTTTSAVDGQLSFVRILDASGVAQTITWVNTENSTVTAPTTSNGSTTLFLSVGLIYNGGTSKWRCIASC